MKCTGKNILLSWVLLICLILPMGIGLAHAFHQHESNLCLALDESHIHAEKTNCEQLHYFSQTLHDGGIVVFDIATPRLFGQNEYYTSFTLIQSFSKADPDRGPPAITVS